MPTFPIREAIAATPRAHIIKLDLHGEAFPYLAGQAAYLQPQGADKRRPYSIASAPEQSAQNGLIEFLVGTESNGSSGLTPALVRPGTPVAIDGPVGSFTFPAHPHEGSVGVPDGEDHARVIARGKSQVSGRDFNLIVAFERARDRQVR